MTPQENTLKTFEYITEDILQPFEYMPEGLPRILPPFGQFKQFKIADQWTYITPSGVVVQEEENTLTDLASVPWFARNLLKIPGRETAGACAHDSGYRNPLRPRWNILTEEWELLGKDDWDEVFNTINIMAGVIPLKRKCLNAGLDLGGWYGWNRNVKMNPCTLNIPLLPIPQLA